MNGGKRAGAGRKRGGKNKATLEKLKVLTAFNERVMTQADALFNAQLVLAVGSIKVFRVDEEEGENGKTKRVHVLVTDPAEIVAVLDEHEGGAGVVGESYYFVSHVLPDNKAIEAMLNRALGKPPDKLVIEDADIDAEIERRMAELASGGKASTFGEAESEAVN